MEGDALFVNGKINVKMAILPQIDLKIQTIPIKPSGPFLAQTEKLILKFIWKCKQPRAAKSTLKKKNKFWGLILCDFKVYCKTIL